MTNCCFDFNDANKPINIRIGFSKPSHKDIVIKLSDLNIFMNLLSELKWNIDKTTDFNVNITCL